MRERAKHDDKCCVLHHVENAHDIAMFTVFTVLEEYNSRLIRWNTAHTQFNKVKSEHVLTNFF